uniref:G_PROTEIN_RECEP_F1_2 domain-containing protein n=1 Tax=Panagrellus redivivus TaxID=6233 RepID=A0A7E4V9I9_PANRE
MSTKDYQHKFNGVISPLGAVMNVLILALIYKKSTTAMANYRKVLLLSSYFDFAMSIYFWLFAPSTGVSKGYYYVVCNGVLGPMPPTFSCVSFMILMWLIYGNVANLAVQYLYRYLALCRNIHMSKLQFTVVVLIGWTPVFTYDIFNLFRYGLSINPNSTLPITILQNTEWDDGNNFPSFAFLPLNTIVLPIVVDNAGINGIPLPSLAFFSLNMVIAAPLLTAIVKVLTIKTFRQYVFSYFKNAVVGDTLYQHFYRFGIKPVVVCRNMALKDFQRTLNGIISPFSVAMNVLILTLIYKKSTTAMANYRKVLLLSSYFDFIMSVYFWLLAPKTGVSQGYYYVVCNGVLGPMSTTVSIISFMVMLWLWYGNASNLAVQYLYRYLALCRNIHMSKYQFAVAVIIGWIPILTYVIFNLFRYGLSINPSSPIPITIFNGTEWDDGNNFPSFVGVFVDDPLELFININAYSLIVFYAIVITTMVLVFRTIAKLNTNTQLSKQTLQAQRQLSYILLFEAFLPLCTIVLPILVDISSMHGLPLPAVAVFSEVVMNYDVCSAVVDSSRQNDYIQHIL